MTDYRLVTTCDHYITDQVLTIDGISPGYTSTLLYQSNNDPTSIVLREFSATEGLTNFVFNRDGVTNFSLDSSNPSLLHFNVLGFPSGVNYVEGLTVVQPQKLYLASYFTVTATCPMCKGNNNRHDIDFTHSGDVSEVSGSEKVSQQVTKILITNLGSNRLHTDYGSGLDSFIGNNLTQFLEFQIQQTIQSSISFLITQQRQSIQQLPLDETITRLSFLDLRIDSIDATKLLITVKVTTADQAEVQAQLTMQIS